MRWWKEGNLESEWKLWQKIRRCVVENTWLLHMVGEGSWQRLEMCVCAQSLHYHTHYLSQCSFMYSPSISHG